MNKILLIILLLISSLNALTLEENDKVIKENIVYLLAKVKDLTKEINQLKKQINQNYYKKVNGKLTTNEQKQKEKIKQIISKIYRVVYDSAPAYDNQELKGKVKKTYHYMDIVRVIKKTKKSYQLDNLLWIDKKYLEPMKINKEKFNYSLKVSFYKIETYMANIRDVPDSSNKDTIVKVLRKGDIVKVVKVITNKKGERWAKLDDNNYINFRLLKPIIW